MQTIKFRKENFLRVLGTLTKAVEGLKSGKDYVIEIKEDRKKRSLNANAYFWELCGKLASVLRIPAEDIYRSYITQIGDNFVTIPIKNEAKSTFRDNWKKKGTGWLCDELGPCNEPGYTYLRCFYGSSTYDSRQMSVLIDFVIQDCKDQGIETLTPDELFLMKARWET